MLKNKIPEINSIDPRLDRRVEFDEKSRQFPIRTLLLEKGQAIPVSKKWTCNVVLDQGSEGACTGFAMAHELASTPKREKDITNEFAMKLYKLAQDNDEWEGNNYSGSSVLGAVKGAVSLGRIKEYRWAFGLDDLVLSLGHNGPAVLGINWYEGMYNPDQDNRIHVAGSLKGGHSILAIGVDVEKQEVILHNSWGKDWAKKGECRISFTDLDRLLHEDGEACIPVKVTV